MKWINVKDRLPQVYTSKKKPFTRVLATDGKKIWDARYRFLIEAEDIHGFFHTFCPFCLDGETLHKITHWMPLPEAPSD